MAGSTLFASETGAALALLERANDLEANPQTLELLVAGAVQNVRLLQLAWSRCTREGDVWERRMYLQRLHILTFLAKVVADLLVKAEEMVARLRKRDPEWAPPSAPDLDGYAQIVQEIASNARKTLEWLERPRPPVTEEMVQRSRESLARGEGEDIRDLMARVERGGSLVGE